MSTYARLSPDDVFGSTSHFLAPPHKSPMKPRSLHTHRSTASLRAQSHTMEDAAQNGRHHSLAHELAVALMPEPSAGSKLLAEEFGIEYDEGAEGIDEGEQEVQHAPSFADEAAAAAEIVVDDSSPTSYSPLSGHAPSLYDQTPFSSPARRQSQPTEQDAMEVLAQNLSSTDKFLSHLRRLDLDAGSSVSQPALETLASDIIRRLNETTRDREGQVRELLEYEREFRKIAGEVGGNDVLGELDELTDMEGLVDQKPTEISQHAESRTLEPVVEEHPHLSMGGYGEWEVDPDQQDMGESEEDAYPAVVSPLKDSFPPPPPIVGLPTPASTVPQLADLRTFTASLVSSLTIISENAQVNGAATTEAGRKIRALKNKIGGWRADWDNAERSRERIERWEAGILDKDPVEGTPSRGRSKREDGRKLVEMHLRGFEISLKEANIKTQAIMARG